MIHALTIGCEDSPRPSYGSIIRVVRGFIRMMLGGKEPSFSDFRGLLGLKATEQLADTVARMRKEDM